MNITDGSMHFEATMGYDKLIKAVKDIDLRLSTIEGAANRAGAALDGMGSLLGKIGGTAVIGMLAKQIINVRKSFQDTQSAMEVFLGSQEKAEKHMKELQDYAWVNVFDFETLTKASAQLQAFGTDVDDTIHIIDNLSNIAAGTKTPLMDMVAMYNKAKSSNGLDSRSLVSFARMGVDVKQVLKDMGEEVAGSSVNFEQFQKAIEAVNAEGGRFHNLMGEQFNNISSLTGAIEDDISKMFNEIGKSLQPAIEGSLRAVHEILDNWRGILAIAAPLVATIGATKTAILLMTQAQKAQALVTALQAKGYKDATVATVLWDKAQKKLNLTMMKNPIVLIVAALAALVTGIIAYNKWANKEGAAEERLAKRMDERLSKQKELIENSDGYIQTLLNEESGVGELTKAYAELSKSKSLAGKTIEELRQMSAREIKDKLNQDLNEAFMQGLEQDVQDAMGRYRASFNYGETGMITTGAASSIATKNTMMAKLGNSEKEVSDIEAQKAEIDEKIAELEAKTSRNAQEDFSLAQLKAESKDLEGELDKATIKLDGLFAKLSNSAAYKQLVAAAKESAKAQVAAITGSAEERIEKLEEVKKEQENILEQSNKYSQSWVVANAKLNIFKENLATLTDDKTVEKTTVDILAQSIEEKKKEINDKQAEFAKSGYSEKDKEDLELLNKTLEEKKKEYKTITGIDYESIYKNDVAAVRKTEDMKLQLKRDGYAKQAELAKTESKRRKEDIDYELANAKLTDKQRAELNEQKLKEDEILSKELSDIYREQQKSIIEARKAIEDAEYKDEQKRINRRMELQQAEIGLMSDGRAKEIAQMRIDHEKRLVEIEREAEEEADALRDANKKRWLNEQTAKGRSVSDSDWYASSAYKSLIDGLTEEQRKQISDNQAVDTGNANALAEKQYKDYLNRMLIDYGDFTAKKKQIDDQYLQDLNAVTLAMLTATTDEEKKMYAELIKDIGKSHAGQTFDLDLAQIDATAYSTVEEKMAAINKAYEEYIQNLIKAGASTEEQNAALQEQVELTGKVATINAQIADIEGKKVMAIESGDTDEVKRLNEEIRKLKKQLGDIDNTSNKKSLGTMFKEWAQELKASDIIGASGELGDVIANIGEAAGNKAIAGFGQALSFAGDIGAKIASGDYLGAALSVITSIGNAIAEDIAKVKAFDEANKQAAVAANQIKINNLLSGEDGIFGSDAVRQVANYIEAIDLANKGLGELGANGGKSFKVLDRSGFAEFFGASDQFSSIGAFARKNGMELYDAYGNLNADVLELFKNTYSDLSEADKQWIDNAIAYTDQYAEAMEGLASYLESIFGNTVDTMVDQLFEGAIDMKAIVADVGKAMAKDLMKSAIMSAYFGDLKEQMTEILKAEGGMTDRAAAEIYGMYSEAMARFENDLPTWQALAEQYKDAFGFGFGEAPSIGPGTALSSASQESIDLMNGQLNAMRTVQGRMDGTINNILLEMRGFRGDMNNQWETNHSKLDQIINNTSSTGLGRSLGLYFGG